MIVDAFLFVKFSVLIVLGVLAFAILLVFFCAHFTLNVLLGTIEGVGLLLVDGLKFCHVQGRRVLEQ